MSIDLRAKPIAPLSRWARRPGSSAVCVAYDGYLLQGPSAEQLSDAVRHVLALNSMALVSPDAPTEDLRAALFAGAFRSKRPGRRGRDHPTCPGTADPEARDIAP